MKLETFEWDVVEREYLEHMMNELEGKVSQDEFNNLSWFLKNFLKSLKEVDAVLVRVVNDIEIEPPEVPVVPVQARKKLTLPKGLNEALPAVPDIDDYVEEDDEPLTDEEVELQEMVKNKVREPIAKPKDFRETIRAYKPVVEINEEDEEDE